MERTYCWIRTVTSGKTTSQSRSIESRLWCRISAITGMRSRSPAEWFRDEEHVSSDFVFEEFWSPPVRDIRSLNSALSEFGEGPSLQRRGRGMAKAYEISIW